MLSFFITNVSPREIATKRLSTSLHDRNLIWYVLPLIESTAISVRMRVGRLDYGVMLQGLKKIEKAIC